MMTTPASAIGWISTSIIVLVSAVVMAGPIDTTGSPHPEAAHVVHEAEHRVDQAWEMYHRAALGGTVASPTTQASIEEHLHMARTLMVQAQEAADQGDIERVRNLVSKIDSHATEAVHASGEQKR